MYFTAVLWLGKIILIVSRLRGGAGSALPGLVAERLYPKFISRFREQLSGGSFLITGTNGKTTTTKLLAGIFSGVGKKLVINKAGSNLSRGIASALLEHANWTGKLDASRGAFEVDEAHLVDVAAKLKPKAIVVLNLHRDQLDRYGELDRTASLIGQALKHASTSILNADDPLVYNLRRFASTKKILTYGAKSSISKKLPHDAALHAHKDKPIKASPLLQITSATSTKDKQKITYTYTGKEYTASIQILGLYNAYNAAAALLCAHAGGIKLSNANKHVGNVPAAFGRTERIEIDGNNIQLLLVKNPAGFNQVIQNFLILHKSPRILIAINDNIADGRDVSWLWDVDFKPLKAAKPKILCSGIRGYDMATRLKYAEINSDTEVDLQKSLNSFLTGLPAGETGYIVPTYTAMLRLRRLIGKRAKLHRMWKYESELGA